MKYVATKTNIFQVVRENENVYYVLTKRHPRKVRILSKREVINEHEGDLKDLVQKWICINKNGEIYNFSSIRMLNAKLLISKCGYQIFGGIWVAGSEGEPILKSVMKINKNGEAELL